MWIAPATLSLPAPAGRIRLEPMTLAHAPALFAALDDPEHWRLRPDPRPRSVADWEARIQKRLSEGHDGSRLPMTIFIAATGECVGTTGFLDIQQENRSLEIGATIVATHWQRTFVNTECKLVLLRHAFAAGAVRVQFKVDTRNERSVRAVLRIGAVQEGVLRKQRVCHDGYIRDTAVFSIIDSEWPAVEARLEAILARS